MPELPDLSFKSNFTGRIANISLRPSANHALAPVFEAITNSIQAIEDKFGKDNLGQGRIEIEVVRGNSQSSKPEGFLITDNGIGFTQENLKSFLESDTRHKIKRGGKGVGRLLWLKVFESAKIVSTFSEESTQTLSFEFVLDEDEPIQNPSLVESHGDSYTMVRLHPFHPEYAAQCSAKNVNHTKQINRPFPKLFHQHKCSKIHSD